MTIAKVVAKKAAETAVKYFIGGAAFITGGCIAYNIKNNIEAKKVMKTIGTDSDKSADIPVITPEDAEKVTASLHQEK